MKPVVRTVLGVPAGFATTAVLSIATTTLLRFVWPEVGTLEQGTALEVLDASYALLYMGVGAYVATLIGFARAGYILTGTFVLLGVATALTQADTAHSIGYQWALAAGALIVGTIGTQLASDRRAGKD